MSDATIELQVRSANEVTMWEIGRLIGTSIDELSKTIASCKEIEYNQKEQEYTMMKTSIEQLNKHVCDLGSTMEELVEAIHELRVSL